MGCRQSTAKDPPRRPQAMRRGPQQGDVVSAEDFCAQYLTLHSGQEPPLSQMCRGSEQPQQVGLTNGTKGSEEFAPRLRTPRSRPNTPKGDAVLHQPADGTADEQEDMVLVCGDCGAEITDSATPERCPKTKKRHY